MKKGIWFIRNNSPRHFFYTKRAKITISWIKNLQRNCKKNPHFRGQSVFLRVLPRSNAKYFELSKASDVASIQRRCKISADKRQTESSLIEKIFGKHIYIYIYNFRKIDFKSSNGNSFSILNFPWVNLSQKQTKNLIVLSE